MNHSVKRTFYVVLLAAVLLVLPACDTIQALVEIADDKSEEGSIRATYNTEEEQRKIAETILQCFDDKDSETLKSLFCERSQVSPDLDEQIQAAFDFYEGKLVSYDDTARIHNSDIRTHTQKHGITRVKSSGTVRSIVTDTDKYYTIVYYSYLLTDIGNEEGISELAIMEGDIHDKNRSGKEVVIGEYFD